MPAPDSRHRRDSLFDDFRSENDSSLYSAHQLSGEVPLEPTGRQGFFAAVLRCLSIAPPQPGALAEGGRESVRNLGNAGAHRGRRDAEAPGRTDVAAGARPLWEEWGNQFRIKEVAKKQRFRAANGQQINHYGERAVYVTSEGF